MEIKIGDKIKAAWFVDTTIGSLSGVMPKVTASLKTVEGTIQKIKADDPVNPKEIRFIVSDGGIEYRINPQWIIAINDQPVKLNQE